MKSFEARTKQTFLRNAFYGHGKYEMPIILKDAINLDNFELIGFNNTKPNDTENAGKTVSFYMDEAVPKLG